ncbi:hypothetical protein MASR2M79_25000 [Aminivibrio sp.]
MDKNQVKEFIAKRVAKELKDGDVINLGIGLPTLVANYVPEGVNTCLVETDSSASDPPPAQALKDGIINAGGQCDHTPGKFSIPHVVRYSRRSCQRYGTRSAPGGRTG